MMSDDVVRDGQNTALRQSRGGGRGIAFLALLTGLIALGVAGYPYLQSGTVAGPSSVDLEPLRVAQQHQAEDLQRLGADSAALDARLQRLQAHVDEERAAASSADALGAVSNRMIDRALKLGEAEFLLRSANDRLLATRDVRAALAMLLAAQSLIDQIDDQTLADVRTALANEVAMLRDVPAADVDATLQRLQAIARAIPELQMRGARFTPVSPAAEDANDASAWTVAWRKFQSLFEFRREGGTVRPPLGPDTAAYLRLNLGLMVQTAELGLLRNDAAVYQQSLESIRRWIDDYLDTNSPDAMQVRGEIDQLLAVRLDATLPDIGRSLGALRDVLTPRSPPAAMPDAPTPAPEAPTPSTRAPEAPTPTTEAQVREQPAETSVIP
jgi:uroporphyrin-III C-methyltransferase